MPMKKLVNAVRKLKTSHAGAVINRRIKEFKKLKKGSREEIFKELCFCILTANFTAERGWKIQTAIGEGFLNLSESGLAEELRKHGHRFPNARAKYIVEARKHIDAVYDFLKLRKHEHEFREWLVKNVKGLGYKEASHFLRNIGYDDVAIIDFHIIDLLSRHGLVEKPKNKSLSQKKYMEIERVIRRISEKLDLKLSESDLYLWYLETGKVLK